METGRRRADCSRTRGTRSGGGARPIAAIQKRKSQAEYKAAQERARREGARRGGEAAATTRRGRRLRFWSANPTGANPRPVPTEARCRRLEQYADSRASSHRPSD